MYKYREYLLKTNKKEEQENQRDLRFCDGRLQKYLQKKWETESDSVKATIVTESY